ncbi:MAG: hypothetical protein LUI60_05780 [Clostridia bacterium]|nr:hypothetical protein [Clostridia bacterium]
MEFTLYNATSQNYRIRNIKNKKTYKIKKGEQTVIKSKPQTVTLRVYNPCFYSVLSFLSLIWHYFIYFIPWIVDMDTWRFLPEKMHFDSLWFGYRVEIQIEDGGRYILGYEMNSKDKKTNFARYSFISHEFNTFACSDRLRAENILFELAVMLVEIGLYAGIIVGIASLVKLIVAALQ